MTQELKEKVESHLLRLGSEKSSAPPATHPGIAVPVLIVDDDDFALSVLEHTLSRMGFSALTARDGREAMEILRRGEVRLVITDWDMPGMNGVELCRAIRHEDLSGYVYIIMLTGREGAKQRMEGLYAGADDFLNKPLDPEELLVCLKAAERILSLETRDLALFALAKLAESRDAEAGAHVERVQSYARLIARHLPDEVKVRHGVDDEYIRLLYQTSPLHDLGKVGIPDNILLKPGKLSPDEFAIMETHTVVGAQTLDAALQRFPHARFLQFAREIAATHHEKFDGSGYPKGLVGEQIPLCGRIVAVADVYDALTSRRVYKAAMTHEQARIILLKGRGTHFDPDVVKAFIAAEPQILAVWERLRDTFEPVETKRDIPAPPPPALAAPSPCKILVAEDDPVLRDKLVELLRATGEPVYATADGLEAMKSWAEHGQRVIVSDWVMPGADGVELCRHIRERSEVGAAHFIMLTMHTDKSRLLDAYKAGVDDFVSKPFDAEELLARVRAGIRTAKLHDELLRKATGSQALSAQLATVNSRLEKLSITDDLTGLFNRRHAMWRLEEQWALAERYGRMVTVALVDIDHFKMVNDTYGHDAGDAVLRRVADILRERTRATDAVCRVGGEEFLIIFPSQTITDACICAERFRKAVEEHPFDIGGMKISATVSLGVATRAEGMAQFPDLLKAADQALYAAKHAGRNVIRTSEKPGTCQPCSDESPSDETLAETVKPQAPPVILQTVLNRCGGDPSFAKAVTERFRAQAIIEVERIEKAFVAADNSEVGRAAHGLKSMAAYMSADAAAEIAKQVEELAGANQTAAIAPLLISLRVEIERAIKWIAENGSTSAARCA